MRKITKAGFLRAIEESNGFIYELEEKFKCSRSTVYRRLEQWPESRKALDDKKEQRHDKVEHRLWDLIQKNNVACILFYLKTQCKSRGYIERQEIGGVPDGKLEVKVEWGETNVQEAESDN